MKQRNIFTKFAIAILLGGSLASCSDDTPVITDANGDKWQVTSFGGILFSYDKDGYLTSITDRETTYNVQKDKFVVSGFYKDCSENAEFTFDKNNNITKVVASFTDTEDGYTSNTTMDYTYDSDQRLKSCTGTSRFQEQRKGTMVYEDKATINYQWNSNQLIVSFIGTTTGFEDGESYNKNYNETYVYTLGGQPNSSKQLPYCMTRSMIVTPEDGGEDFPIGMLLAVLGLYGNGPENLPTKYTENRMEDSYSYNHLISCTQNSNGTLMQEKKGYDYGNGNTYWSDPTYYIYTATRADGVATQSLMELLYNSFRHTAPKHRGE